LHKKPSAGAAAAEDCVKRHPNIALFQTCRKIYLQAQRSVGQANSGTDGRPKTRGQERVKKSKNPFSGIEKNVQEGD
jgi:hypothetical protein